MAPFIYLLFIRRLLRKKAFFFGSLFFFCFLLTLLGKQGFANGLVEGDKPPSRWRRKRQPASTCSPLSASQSKGTSSGRVGCKTLTVEGGVC